jgi:hypothetical protein
MDKCGKSKRLPRGLADQRIKELREKYLNHLTDPLEVLLLLAHGVEPDPESEEPNALRPILAGIDAHGNPIFGIPVELRSRPPPNWPHSLTPRGNRSPSRATTASPSNSSSRPTCRRSRLRPVSIVGARKLQERGGRRSNSLRRWAVMGEQFHKTNPTVER